METTMGCPPDENALDHAPLPGKDSRTAAAFAMDWASSLLGRGFGTPGKVATVGHLARGTLPLHPIDPSWIEEGNPVARAVILTSSPDERFSSGVWECTAGKFRWVYGIDEVVHILEGNVTLHESGGSTYTLGPGDVAYFPLGLVTHWDVKHYVRKFFVARSPGGSRHVARLRQRLDF
jgi:uncharacterized cupin superfamily protein